MKIGELSTKTGCNIETIRYYERVGLITKPGRTESNYRIYNIAHFKQLKFILKTRLLGFSLSQIKELLSLSVENNLDSCQKIQEISKRHIILINQKIKDLNLLKDEHNRLLNHCESNATTKCQFINAYYES